MKLTSDKTSTGLRGNMAPVSYSNPIWERSSTSAIKINEIYTDHEESNEYETLLHHKHAFVTEWTVYGQASVQKTFSCGSKDDFIVEW